MQAYRQVSIGQMLRDKRKSAGLNQQQLAEKANVSLYTISRIERGDTKHSRRDTLVQLADALDFDSATSQYFYSLTQGERPHMGEQADAEVFVGRQAELRQLVEHFNHRDRRVIIYLGASGVGKSALITHVMRERRAHSWQILKDEVSEIGEEALPFVSVIDIFCQTIKDTRRLRDLIGDCHTLLKHCPVSTKRLYHQYTSPLHHEDDVPLLLADIVQFLQRISQAHPVLLVLDDLQWLSSSGVTFLAKLAWAIQQRQFYDQHTVDVMFLVGGQSDPHQLLARCGEVGIAHELHAFTTAESLRFLQATLLDDATKENVKHITKMTGNHPLYLRHFVDYYRQHGIWPREIPAELLLFLQRQIQSLNNANGDLVTRVASDLLTYTALCTVIVTPRHLQRLLQLPEMQQRGWTHEALSDATTLLSQRRLIVHQENGYRCTHIFIAKATRKLLTPLAAQEWHQRILIILGKMPETKSRYLVYHARKAQCDDVLRDQLLSAADAAFSKGEYDEAHEDYRYFASHFVADADHGLHARLSESLGQCLLYLGALSDALTELQQARNAYQICHDVLSVGRITALMGQIYRRTINHREGWEFLRSYIDDPAATPDPAVRSAIWIEIAHLSGIEQEDDIAIAAAEKAVAYASAADNAMLKTRALGCKANALLRTYDMQQAITVTKEAFWAAQSVQDERLLLDTYYDQMMLFLFSGGQLPSEALDNVTSALQLARRLNDPFMLGFFLFKRGEILFWFGDWQECLRSMDQSYEFLRQAEPTWLLPLPLAGKSLILCLQGKLDDFRETVITAKELVRRYGFAPIVKQWLDFVEAEHEIYWGNLTRALAMLEAQLTSNHGNYYRGIINRIELSYIHYRLENYAEAISLASEGMLLSQQYGLTSLIGDCQRVYSLALMHREQTTEVGQNLQASCRFYRNANMPFFLGRALWSLGEWYHLIGDVKKAHATWQESLQVLGSLQERMISSHIEKSLALLSHASG